MRALTRVRRRRKPTYYITWFIIFFFFISVSTTILLTLPLWRIKKVLVQGTSIIPSQRVVNTARIPLEENIFFIDLKEPIKRLSLIPQISLVEIHRKLPDIILIKIFERKPIAVVLLGRESFVIDRDGIILKKEGNPAFQDITIPNISDLPVIRLKGQKLTAEHSMAIGSVIEGLTKFLEPKTLQIDLSQVSGIVLLVDDILKVKLGDVENLSKKIAVLGTLLSQPHLKWEDIEYIDIRVVTAPVIKFKE